LSTSGIGSAASSAAFLTGAYAARRPTVCRLTSGIEVLLDGKVPVRSGRTVISATETLRLP
jgi:hypothetical protein